ncbi:hypothetical protein DPMN_109363 [Dreissena polymorpha]|uniref:Uncharacterized protein n=1 Tax=Dreissena polymorpha TaxID=45954 RepID=A0A9D4QM33_DREPO|nr:hypothetical protein DPMN_109363 [Dreissena polymorpha]
MVMEMKADLKAEAVGREALMIVLLSVWRIWISLMRCHLLQDVRMVQPQAWGIED